MQKARVLSDASKDFKPTKTCAFLYAATCMKEIHCFPIIPSLDQKFLCVCVR